MVFIQRYLGYNNSAIGIVLIFICMFKVNQISSLKSYLKMSVILIIISIFASLASLNLYTSVILNLILPFCIIFFTISKGKTSNYFIYGHEYIMLQSYPITLREIPLRIIAVAFALLVCYVYMKIYNRKVKFDTKLLCDGDLILYNIKNFKQEFNLKTSRTRFAIRASFILWITCVIMDMVPDRNIRSYWLPLITYSSLELDYQKQQDKLMAQIGGTTLGIGIFTLIFHWIPLNALMIFMAIAFTMLFAIENQYLKKAIGTILGMSFVIQSFGEIGSILLRYTYVLAAILIIAIFECLRKGIRKVEKYIEI